MLTRSVDAPRGDPITEAARLGVAAGQNPGGELPLQRVISARRGARDLPPDSQLHGEEPPNTTGSSTQGVPLAVTLTEAATTLPG
jgi:hypothetical protein